MHCNVHVYMKLKIYIYIHIYMIIFVLTASMHRTCTQTQIHVHTVCNYARIKFYEYSILCNSANMSKCQYVWAKKHQTKSLNPSGLLQFGSDVRQSREQRWLAIHLGVQVPNCPELQLHSIAEHGIRNRFNIYIHI